MTTPVSAASPTSRSSASPMSNVSPASSMDSAGNLALVVATSETPTLSRVAFSPIRFQHCATPALEKERKFFATFYKENPKIAELYERHVVEINTQMRVLDNRRSSLEARLKQLDPKDHEQMQPDCMALALAYAKVSKQSLRGYKQLMRLCRETERENLAISRRFTPIPTSPNSEGDSPVPFLPMSPTNITIFRKR